MEGAEEEEEVETETLEEGTVHVRLPDASYAWVRHRFPQKDLSVRLPKRGASQILTYPFACPYEGCDRKFKRREHLNRHIHLHTGVKPFQCDRCGRRFTRKDSLRNHRVLSRSCDRLVLLNAVGEQEPSSDADQPSSTQPDTAQPTASTVSPSPLLPGRNCNISANCSVNQEHDPVPNGDTIVLDPEPDYSKAAQTASQKLKASDPGHQRPVQMQLSYILNP